MVKQPISTYTYYTKEAAIAASRQLGCNGYRTYVIDGKRVYLPCDELADFERLTSYTIVRGVIVSNGNETFGGNLVGMQFTSNDRVSGDAFFTLGNFSLNTNVMTGGRNENFVVTTAGTLQHTTESITQSSGDTALAKLEKITADETINFNFDKTRFDRYTLFGSLSDKIKFSLIEISEKFPASITLKPGTVNTPTIFNYQEDIQKKQSTFKINLSSTFNPFGLICDSTGYDMTDDDIKNPLRNLTKQYRQYDLVYLDERYDVLGFGANSDNQTITVTISGLPFRGKITPRGTLNMTAFITPKQSVYRSVMDEMSDMAKYLLNEREMGTMVYSAEFRVPMLNNNGDIDYNVQVLSFPKYDKYNIDLLSNEFDVYATTLNNIANDFDSYKTNLVSRFLTAETLKEFDTEDRKVDIILKSYGRTFDAAKKYIDALSFMTRVSYDKIENIPDVLLKNFARTLGWKTYEIEDAETIAESLFEISATSNTIDLTPIELDTELWRRLLLNTSWLFKSKGTRQGIDTILKLVGVPELIYEINEYVAIAQHRLEYSKFQQQLIDLSDYPIDLNGYPTIPTVPFQSYGGTVVNDNGNSGPYDFGRTYLDAFRYFQGLPAFDVYEILDNRKVWVVTDTPITRVDDTVISDTKYDIKDSRLLINIKRLDVHIGLDRIMDSRVYKLFVKEGVDLTEDYPKTIKPATLTFNTFLRECIENFINPTNRKTVITYPTLTKVYYDYINKCKELNLNSVNYNISLSFLQKFDTYWVELIKQFVPATSIFGSGKKIANSKLNDNKFKYRHGQNMSNNNDWVGTDGSEFQETTLRPVVDGAITLFRNNGEYGKFIVGNTITMLPEGLIDEPIKGELDRVSSYEGYHYSRSETCSLYVTVNNYTVSPNRQTIIANLDSTSGITRGQYIRIDGAYGPGKQSELNGIWKIQEVTPTTVIFDLETLVTVGNDVYADNFGFAIIGSKMYLDNWTNFYCNSVLPHAAYYDNKVRSISSIYFLDGQRINSRLNTYSSSSVDLTNMLLGGLDEKYIVEFANPTGLTQPGNFVIKTVLGFLALRERIFHLELKYENLITYNFLNDDIYDGVLNPILVLQLKQNGISVSDEIKVELTPTIINNQFTSNTIRLYGILNTVNKSVDIDLHGTVIVPDMTDLLNIERVTNDGSDSPFGTGDIKILGHSIHLTPAYSDSILSTTIPTNFITDWFRNKFFIQQPKLYGLSLSEFSYSEKPQAAVMFNFDNEKWMLPFSTEIGEVELLRDISCISPLMHIPTILQKKYVLTNSDDILINLSDELNMKYLYPPVSGDFNQYSSVYSSKVDGNGQINGVLHLSNDFIVNFDGFYPTVGTIIGDGPGPIYKIRKKPEITSYVNNMVCQKGVDTYLKLAKPTDSFSETTDLVAIGGTTSSFYQVNDYRLYSFKMELIFDLETSEECDILIMLVDSNKDILYSERITIGGSTNPNYIDVNSRTVAVEKSLFIPTTKQVYWVVRPLDQSCFIKTSEEILVNPQEYYDKQTFVNIIPAKWSGFDKISGTDSLFYDETISIGLPTMFLSYGNGGYLDDYGSVSKQPYLTDMARFAENFRYSNDFYYDKIIFETVQNLSYKTLSISESGIVVNANKTVNIGKNRFEYIPFYKDSIVSNEPFKFETAIGLINHSDMFDISEYADFGTINLGKKHSPGLRYDFDIDVSLAQEERTLKVAKIINDVTLEKSYIDPLDWAYFLTGPIGLDGMSQTKYPFGLINGSLVGQATSWPYISISTHEQDSGYPFTGDEISLESYPIVADLTDGPNGLLSLDTFNGSVVLVINDDGLLKFRQLSTENAADYQTIDNWVVVISPKYRESLFTVSQNLQPLLGSDSLLNYTNQSLKSADDSPIYWYNKSAQFKLLSSFLCSVINVDGTVANGYLPRGLSNTYIKYQKFSHAWVYASNIYQTTNITNLYSSNYMLESTGDIRDKVNMNTIRTKLVKNIDNNAWVDYSNSVNLFNATKYGTVSFEQENDLFLLRYKLPKNITGIPLTGEFISRLTVRDLVGNSASTFLKLFIVNQSTKQGNFAMDNQVDSQTVINFDTEVTDGRISLLRRVTINLSTRTEPNIFEVIISSIGMNGIVNRTETKYVTTTQPFVFDFNVNDRVIVDYKVFDPVLRVQNIDINGINDSWLATGSVGRKTFEPSVLTSNFDLTFNLIRNERRFLSSI